MKGAEISTLITQGRAYHSSSFLFKTLENKAIMVKEESKAPIRSTNKPEKPNKPIKPVFITPKKVFKTAVLRNKGKRRAKAAFLSVTHYFSLNTLSLQGKYLLFMLKIDVLEVDMKALKIEIQHVLLKSGIIKA